MSLLSCREIRNQLLILVGAATAALAVTTVVLDGHSTRLEPQSQAVASEDANLQSRDEFAPILTRNQVNWDDVNLTGQVNSPDDEVKTARSKMLGDFEAR